CFASCGSPSAMNGSWPRYREDFIVIGSYVHQVAQRRMLRSDDESPHLTMRESEVLLWTARGKTAWETGEILDIAEETVRFHLKNATRKFAVSSKHQAVVQAIIHGLIVP
ncbi:MAG TPA: helix-turn-helix transcriptional regulator, partial [Kiloniellaceae bacterium]|nr:helix-turn-helix transcriptional regulator [Kiloniellaceae bacterium]